LLAENARLNAADSKLWVTVKHNGSQSSGMMKTLISEFGQAFASLIAVPAVYLKMAPYPSGKGKAGIAFCGGSNPSGASAF
jgi:hypothetical protein